MQKNFSKWHAEKEKLEIRSTAELYFKEREVWWCAMGVNVGYEQDGQGELFLRPVLIFRKLSRYLFVGIPLSTTKKTGRYYFQFSFLPDVISNALLSQVRVYDTKRLKDKMATIAEKDMESIQKALREIL